MWLMDGQDGRFVLWLGKEGAIDLESRFEDIIDTLPFRGVKSTNFFHCGVYDMNLVFGAASSWCCNYLEAHQVYVNREEAI